MKFFTIVKAKSERIKNKNFQIIHDKTPLWLWTINRILKDSNDKVYVNTDSGSLYVQTPKVNVLWDTKFYQGDNEGCGNYPVEFSLSDLQNNPTMKSFYDMLVSFDEHLVELAYQNRKDWFDHGIKPNDHQPCTHRVHLGGMNHHYWDGKDLQL